MLFERSELHDDRVYDYKYELDSYFKDEFVVWELICLWNSNNNNIIYRDFFPPKGGVVMPRAY